MAGLKERVSSFFNNRWLVLVAAMWIQSCAGIAYLFGSISPTIKSSLNYNQRQVAKLGVAKDLGDNVGFLAGSLSEILPLWALLLIGALQNFVGHGWVWLIVSGRAPVLPLWAMCFLIFVATNGETYFNTASLVSCVQNFPKSRGPVVGILKGFAGLSGAILTQIYAVIHSPNQASLIFMVAVGPTMVVVTLMFLVRPVGGHIQARSSDGLSFSIVYSICLLLAAYLFGVMLVQDLVHLSHMAVVIFTMVLLILLLIPAVIPIKQCCSNEMSLPAEEALLPKQESRRPVEDDQDIILSEVEDEMPTEGAIKIKKRRPRRGEDFTLMEALVKADFWLLFFSFLLGSGSGLTLIDNLGQITESLGYHNTHVFVSMISIWNFLGRIGGGYFSERIVRKYAYPRPVAMAAAQAIMVVGHFFSAMDWPGAMYIVTLLVGLGYGAHWSIVPATVSELFGLKKFGPLYNFLTLANPAATLIFSGLIASSIYDREAEKQALGLHHKQHNAQSVFSSFVSVEEPAKCEGSICYFLTSLIMSGFCILAIVLSMILVRRTKIVYAHLYQRSGT